LADVLAYTWHAAKHQRRAITVPVRLTVPSTKADYQVTALVDTGATGSCVSNALAKQLCLIPLSMVNVNSAHGRRAVPVYCLDLLLPNGTAVPTVEATEFHKAQNFDFIIGMNILQLGDMAVSNAHDETVFSFRIPPADKHIDFTL
jgi:predicted aspartyl protease